MKVSLRTMSLLPCMAFLLAVTPIAHAQYSVSGEVWEAPASGLVDNSTDSVPALGSAVYSSTPTAAFTLTNSTSASDLFDFYSANDGPGATGGLSSFLTSAYSSGNPNGDTLTYLAGGTKGSSAANDSIDDDLFKFTGTTALANGTYDFEHDDGLLLYLNGVLVVNEGGPTAAAETTLCVGTTGCDYNIATTGDVAESFTLLYAEVDGPPAVLDTNLPLTGPPPTVTPEPGSLTLMGTGVLALAGMIRRRFAA